MRLLSSIIIVLGLLDSSITLAQRAEREPGFSGKVMFGAVALESSSSDSTLDDGLIIDSIYEQAPSQSKVIPGVIGEVAFTFNNTDHQLFAGLNRVNVVRGEFVPEVGYRYFYGDYSKLEFAVLPGIQPKETWVDPFITGQRRVTTDQSTQAARFRAENVLGPVSIEAAVGDRKIDADSAGATLGLTNAEQMLLQRSAALSYLSIEVAFPASKQLFLRPGLFRYEEDADGDANDFVMTGVELNALYRSGRHTFALSFAYEHLVFDTANPVYTLERDESGFNIFGMYQFAEPLGYDNTKLMLIASNRLKDSNIDFYTEETLILGTGLLFEF